MNRILWIVLGWLSVLVTAVHAASFDCSKARSEIERMICSDDALSKLDDSLYAQYQQALQRNDVKEKVIKSQRAWLKYSRNICQTNDCVKKTYESRIKELGLTSSFGLVFITTPPGSKLPASKASATEAAPVAPLVQETKQFATIPIASPDEYMFPDNRCPNNLGAARKYDIYHGLWVTYVQDRTWGLGVSEKAVSILDTTSEMELSMLCDGNVVAAWAAYLPGMRKQDFVSITIYDSQLSPLTDEFRVDESEQVQSDQSVAPLKNGGFVVTWRTDAQNAEEKFATHLHARIFGPDGKPITSVIDISSNNQLKTRAKAYGLPNGGFVVAWNEALYSICLKYFDASGKPSSDVIHLLSNSDFATQYDITDYGYVARDGSFNLFIPPSSEWLQSPIFKMARSVSSTGALQTEVLNQDELKNLPGYQLMVDKYVHSKSLFIGMALPGFNSHDKNEKPNCGMERNYGYLTEKLSFYSKDADVLKLLRQVNDVFSKCP